MPRELEPAPQLYPVASSARPAMRPWRGVSRFAAPCAVDLARFGTTPLYAAIDLGTNNCRLLIAKPEGAGFRVVDSFSRIVRLGEGLSQTGALGEGAMARTLEALLLCRHKLDERGVARGRFVATEACRAASNGAAFLAQIKAEVGLDFERLDRHSEALLAASGCAALADPAAKSVVLFDIGGGSTELVWLDVAGAEGRSVGGRARAWASLPLGVVTLAERHGGQDVSPALYEAMVAETQSAMAGFITEAGAAAREPGFHLLGTSGTVTTLGGLFLRLERYDRRRIDGLWMDNAAVDQVLSDLLAMNFEARAANGCIGRERADLVLAGCAIFEAIRRAFPAPRLRIGDRGLREGMLMEMMRQDGALA